MVKRSKVMEKSSEVSEVNKNDIPEFEIMQALEAVRGGLRELPESRLIQLRYTAAEAASRGLWMADHARRDRGLFEKMYREPPVEEIASLDKRAMAVLGAQQEENPKDPPAPPDLERCRGLRERHLSIYGAVFFGDEAIQAKLAEIRSGQGHHDLGSDLVGLVGIASNNWARLETTGLIPRQELTEMQGLSMDVLRWAGRREGEAKSTRELEKRAWTHMAAAYNKIRDYAQILYREEPAVWERDYPSLYSPTFSSK